MSSGYSASALTWIGSVSAVDSTVSSSTATSTSPVTSLGLMAAGARATTLPVTLITLSRRTDSAAAKPGLPVSNTHWVRP